MLAIDNENTKENSYGTSVDIDNLHDVIPRDEGYNANLTIINNYLNKHSIKKVLVFDFDFAKNLASGNSVHAVRSQCRIEGLNEEELREMEAMWVSGVKMKEPPIGVLLENGEVHLGLGNHRGYSKARVKQKDRVILVGEGLPDSEKLKVLAEIAARSNSRTTTDKRTDTVEDISFQVKTAWTAVKTVDPNSTSSVYQDDRHWNKMYNGAKSAKAAESIRRSWFDSWIKANKPLRNSQATQTKIYNQAFSSQHGQRGLADYTEKDFKKIFSEKLPGYKWNPKKYDIKKGSDIWQFASKWNNRIENSPLNIRRMILDTVFTATHKTSYQNEIHIVIHGDTNVTTLDGRQKHIDVVIKGINEYNTNAKRKKWNSPVVSKIIFTRQLNNVSDDHRVYEVNTQTNKLHDKAAAAVWTDLMEHLEKINEKPSPRKPTRAEVVTVAEKRCSTCGETKPVHKEKPVNFYTCRPPRSKDGVQPRCIPCCKEYERAKRKNNPAQLKLDIPLTDKP
tara:strand:- start:3122 stop:4639 length:1518 start_codon:yes stop_codon:yes gene_type:complete